MNDDLPPADYLAKEVSPPLFRELITNRGAVMLRNAVERTLLVKYGQSLEELLARYSGVPLEEFEQHLQSPDPKERDLWEQIKLSHIFDRTFKPLAGYSYFDIVRSSGLWELGARAFPESPVTESAVSNSRRVTDNDVRRLWDTPIEFHVDSQFFYHHILSINFWTPLVPCGVDAPSLKVIDLSVARTKAYLEYNPKGYENPEPKDFAFMSRFRCSKMAVPMLEKHGLLKRMWAPEFKLGDVLAFTNFTMHATHFTKGMTRPRTSIEVRVDFPGLASRIMRPTRTLSAG